MNVMTVSISQNNGGVVYTTVKDLPHQAGKFIAGFSIDAEDAMRRVLAYAGGPVEFVEA